MDVRLLYGADKQTFQAIAHWHCLSVQPAFNCKVLPTLSVFKEQCLFLTARLLDVRLLYRADKQTFQAIAHWHCLSVQPAFDCEVLPTLSVFKKQCLFLTARSFYKQRIMSHTLVLAAVVCSLHLPSHTVPLLFSSV